MQKVALISGQFLGNLPPYRFAAGDVIEVDDDWAEHLVRQGIAQKAKASDQSVMEKILAEKAARAKAAAALEERLPVEETPEPPAITRGKH